MQKLIVALALTPAAAFMAKAPAHAAVRVNSEEEAAPSAPSGKAALVALAEDMAGPPGYWDPFDFGSQDYVLGAEGVPVGNAATVGFLRHAEIKHGRVAMAGFLGFIAGCNPVVAGEHTFAPYRGYVAGVTPQEQWDNIPIVGKLQILIAIGMLESYGEGADADDDYVHYMKGGMPGYYPDIKGKGASGQITFNLYDPFGFGFRGKSEAQRARGRKSEILNGRAAMLGLMGFLSESSIPGSVPFLSKIEGFPRYAGNVMAPFDHDFHLF